MIVLNQIARNGVRRLELYADDVAVVSSVPGAIGGSEIETIDSRRFYVAESVADVHCLLEESDDGAID